MDARLHEAGRAGSHQEHIRQLGLTAERIIMRALVPAEAAERA
ncbi:hypothetical protein [Microcella putealis]|nr:hypothetical protein [Microcella putealis]